jgi:hypothetical protein
MKSYPSIQRLIDPLADIIAFDKIDGSNIRAEWSPKRGFYKFGSRRCIIDENSEHLGGSVSLIKDMFADDLVKVFRNRKWMKQLPRSVVCFFEYHGPNSFAGFLGNPEDDLKVTLIDVSPHKRGIIGPKEFIDFFGHLDIAAPLYYGKADESFVNSVRDGSLTGMTFEGVVCKETVKKGKNSNNRLMFKIKNRRWLNNLKTFCGSDDKKYEMLK